MTDYLDCYTRVSTTDQTKGFSLDTQSNIGEKIAHDKGLKFRLRDEGGRSSIRFRPVLEDLKDDIEKGLVRHLWVYDRSRLFRDETDSSLFRKDYLDKFGIQFYEGELGNLVNFDSLEEKLSYDIISKLQQYENEKRSHKSKQGKRHLLRQGLDNRWYGGTVLFGYKSENGVLSIDEEESQWIVWMFNAVLDGLTTMDIKNELDRNGIVPPRTKSGLWNLGSINKILANRSYIGERSFYDKELDETFTYSIDPIISRPTFLRVRKEVERRQKLQDNNKKHVTLFGDYLECECGQKYGSEIKKGTRRNGQEYNTKVYYCLSRNRSWKNGTKSSCLNTRSMNIPLTDQYLLDHIQTVVSNSHLLKERFKTDVLTTKFSRDKDLESQEKRLSDKCKKLVRRQEQTYENIIVLETDLLQKRTEKKIAQGILNRLRDELDNLKEEVTKTELEIEGLSEERVWLDWVQKFGEDLQHKMSDPENHASWVKGLIDKIVVKTAMGEDRDGNRKQVGHKFDVYFKMKVVRDKLAYLDPDNKGLGYGVREGRSKSSSKVVNLSRSRGKKKDLSDLSKYNHRSELIGDSGVST